MKRIIIAAIGVVIAAAIAVTMAIVASAGTTPTAATHRPNAENGVVIPSQENAAIRQWWNRKNSQALAHTDPVVTNKWLYAAIEWDVQDYDLASNANDLMRLGTDASTLREDAMAAAGDLPPGTLGATYKAMMLQFQQAGLAIGAYANYSGGAWHLQLAEGDMVQVAKRLTAAGAIGTVFTSDPHA